MSDPDVSHAAFTCPDLTTFTRLDDLGLEAVGQQVPPDRCELAWRVVEADRWCHECGCEGIPRDTVIPRLAHEPQGWRPVTLVVRLRRYQCSGCSRVWRQDMGQAAQPRSKLSQA